MCDRECPSGGYDHPAGYECHDCHDLFLRLHPPKPIGRMQKLWRKVAWPIGTQVDRLYWWYCERYGKRILL